MRDVVVSTNHSRTSALAQVQLERDSCRVARIPSPAAALVGSRIRERRLELEMTQDQLAYACEIDPSNLRAYEPTKTVAAFRTCTPWCASRPRSCLSGRATCSMA